jgi:hypothetical protein
LPESRAQEPQIRRGIFGDLGKAISKRDRLARETIGIPEIDLGLPGLAFGVSDSAATDVFDLLAAAAPGVTKNWLYQLWLRGHLNRDSNSTLQAKAPDVAIAALMSTGDSDTWDEPVHPDNWNDVDRYFQPYSEMGPKRSGVVEVVVGPMGSGKTNFLVWRAIHGAERGYETFSDIHLNRGREGYHENYLASTLLLDLVKFARGEPKLPGQILLGEAAGRGGNSKTATTLEARFRMLFLERVRMFRCNVSSAYQAPTLPSDQASLTAVLVDKAADPDPAVVRVKWIQRAYAGRVSKFTIPNFDSEYDTYAKAGLHWDINMEELDAYLSKHHGEGAELDLVEGFITDFQRGGDPGAETFGGEKEAREMADYLPPELAAPPEGGWLVACTQKGCTQEWTYTGRLPAVRGARIMCPLNHHSQLQLAIMTRAERDRRRGAPAPEPVTTTTKEGTNSPGG